MDELKKKLFKCRRGKAELKKALALLIEKSEEINSMSICDIDCVGFGNYGDIIKYAIKTLQKRG